MRRIELAGDREPWERQDGEPQRAHEALTAYLDLGPTRTIAWLSQSVTAPLSRLREWHRDGQWGRRARYWDRHHEWTLGEARTEAHDRAAADLTDAAAAATRMATRRIAEADPDELSAAEAVKVAADAGRVLAATRPERPVPPPHRTALADALATGADPAAAAYSTAVEVTATTSEAAGRGDQAAAKTATGLLASLATTSGGSTDLNELLTLIEAALAPYPDARAAVLAAVTHETPGAGP